MAFVDACNVLKKEGIVKTLPFSDMLAAVSVGVVMNEELLDLNYKEDSNASIDMNVIMTASNRIIEIQTTAEGAPFTRNRFDKLLDLAQKGIGDIIKVIKASLAGEP